MKKFWSLLLSVTMVASLAACGGSSSGGSTSGDAANTGDSANTEAVHFKLSHPSAEGGPYDLMSKKFAELVEEKSGGKYVIDIFAANALGSQEEVLDAVSLGTLDMAVTSDDILAKYAPEWGYIGLPFLFDDVDDVDENLNGELGAYLSGKLEDKGMFVISFFENGFRNITANKEINTPQDLAGLKIRVMTNEPLRAMFTNAGAVVTNVSFSELYQALQLGTCEAEENPFANIRDKKFYEVQSYMCVTMHSHTAEPLVMSKELFDGLSAEDQAMFQEAGLEASKWAYQHAKDTDAENREYLEGQMTVIDPDRELWKEFAAETNASYEANYTEAAALKI
jgi:tripartite ATP-independent transporter DctP family solute receptor